MERHNLQDFYEIYHDYYFYSFLYLLFPFLVIRTKPVIAPAKIIMQSFKTRNARGITITFFAKTKMFNPKIKLGFRRRTVNPRSKRAITRLTHIILLNNHFLFFTPTPTATITKPSYASKKHAERAEQD
jgi:hypothetical protein